MPILDQLADLATRWNGAGAQWQAEVRMYSPDNAATPDGLRALARQWRAAAAQARADSQALFDETTPVVDAANKEAARLLDMCDQAIQLGDAPLARECNDAAQTVLAAADATTQAAAAAVAVRQELATVGDQLAAALLGIGAAKEAQQTDSLASALVAAFGAAAGLTLGTLVGLALLVGTIWALTRARR